MSQSQWELTFATWAAPPGKVETDRCDNAVSVIKKALDTSEHLKGRPTRVFVQGSYRNRTNVRADSDVDIGIEYAGDTFFPKYPKGMTREDFGNTEGSYNYFDFKDAVERALVDRFGRAAVVRGNKAFDITENSYRVEADVAVFFEHRRYSKDGSFLSGVELRPDRERHSIINWPEQHYSNGVGKNKITAKRYKSVVRILKKLRNKMLDEGYKSAEPLIGFFIECLVWNTPNTALGHNTYYEDVRETIAYLYNATKDANTCSEWGEVSELKYLFRGDRTAKQANEFLLDAWRHVGFK